MDIKNDIDCLRSLRQSENNNGDKIIRDFFEEGSFAELGTFVTSPAGNIEPVICGYGAVDGKLVYSFIEVFEREKGAFGAASAKKICNTVELAKKNGAPLVAFFDSAGARVSEGLSVLDSYGSVMKAIADAQGLIPRIAVVNGVCSGAAAVIAKMFDVVIAAGDKAEMFINPPFLFDAKEKALFADITADSMTGACGKIKQILDFIAADEYYISDDLNRKTPELESVLSGSYKIASVLDVLCGSGGYAEIFDRDAPEAFTGLINIGNMAVGIAANNPSEKDGALTVGAAVKIKKMVSLCAAFDIPLLTLVDTCGYDYSDGADKSMYDLPFSELAREYAFAQNPMLTVILGRAYGSAATLLASKALGADLVYAVSGADISTMPPESAVQFLYGDKIKEASDPNGERNRLLGEYKKNNSSPAAAAGSGIIDDIIEYDSLRQRIISAFEMLKNGR